MELSGCAALVTGGTGGLGSLICQGLAKSGANVAVVYKQSQAQAKSLAAELSVNGPRAVAIQADVTDTDSIAHMVDQTMKEFGRIDILINDAAFNKYVRYPDLDSLTLDLWRFIIESNLTGPFQCIKALAPVMREQKRGRIVNIASVAGLRPSGSSIGYSVSKAALIQLTRCMAVALAPDVIVNCVAPGFIEGTRMTQNLPPDHIAANIQQSALKRSASKEDVVNQVLTFCRTDTATGQTMVIDAGRFYH